MIGFARCGKSVLKKQQLLLKPHLTKNHYLNRPPLERLLQGKARL